MDIMQMDDIWLYLFQFDYQRLSCTFQTKSMSVKQQTSYSIQSLLAFRSRLNISELRLIQISGTMHYGGLEAPLGGHTRDLLDDSAVRATV
jgi:hypothetical protein